MLAAVEVGMIVVEYTPAEIKRAVVGYGRAEKPQVQQMVKLILGLPAIPTPHDAADALAIAICHAHSAGVRSVRLQADEGPAKAGHDVRSSDARSSDVRASDVRSSAARSVRRPTTSWRTYRP
jgi:crossover junction endodeoxyribonuclease RuvC